MMVYDVDDWNTIRDPLSDVLEKLGLPWWVSYSPIQVGIIAKPYKNTFKRKRTSTWMIEVRYVFKGHVIWRHVEPAKNFPSDHLIAQMALLPKVTSDEV